MKYSHPLRTCFIWLFWLGVWQGASLLINNNILFVGPVEMAASLWGQLDQTSFWLTILYCL